MVFFVWQPKQGACVFLQLTTLSPDAVDVSENL